METNLVCLTREDQRRQVGGAVSTRCRVKFAASRVHHYGLSQTLTKVDKSFKYGNSPNSERPCRVYCTIFAIAKYSMYWSTESTYVCMQTKHRVHRVLALSAF